MAKRKALRLWIAVLAALPAAAALAQAPAASPSPRTSSPIDLSTGIVDFKKGPTYVKADSLTLQSEKRYFIYSGNVEVIQGDMTITCNALDGTYNQKNQIEQLTAKENVQIVKASGLKARGERAIYSAAAQTVTITDNPELEQDGSVLSADSIVIYTKENRSVAQGQVRVKLVKKPEELKKAEEKEKERKQAEMADQKRAEEAFANRGAAAAPNPGSPAAN